MHKIVGQLQENCVVVFEFDHKMEALSCGKYKGHNTTMKAHIMHML